MEKIAASETASSSTPLTGPGTAIGELRALLSSEKLDRLPKRFSMPMSLDRLEMLEAELRNQGILADDKDVTTLVQSALHTASILRWRARRAGISGDDIQFSVRVPQYVLTRAEEIESELRDLTDSASGGRELLVLRSGTWGKGLDGKNRLLRDLLYLEQFAAYLIGRFDSENSRYHRGLNLLLSVLSGKAAAEDSANDAKNQAISLPIGHREFLDELKLSSQP